MYESKWDDVGVGTGSTALDLGPLKERLHRQVIDSLDLSIVAKLDHEIASNGTILNLKIHPSALKNNEGLQKFSSLIRTFFDLYGMQVQFNIITVEDLRKAQKAPEAFRNLVVKVAGYSAHFTSLDRRLQDQIIERTTHDLS